LPAFGFDAGIDDDATSGEKFRITGDVTPIGVALPALVAPVPPDDDSIFFESFGIR
jgi:hypothetical protein